MIMPSKKSMQTIPVFFTFDRYYVVAAEVAIHSLLKHASAQYEYRLYILHPNLTERQQRRLHTVVGRFPNATLEFINTRQLETKYPGLQDKNHFSKDIFYKLTAAELFPQYDRIICTDVDVVFTGDISPSFFLYPDKDFYFAGVGQVTESRRMDSYVGRFSPEEIQKLRHEIMAGYLLLNLKHIRAQGMQQRLTDFYLQNFHRLSLPEQDTITLCCWPALETLPMKYVVCNYYYETDLQSLQFYPECQEFAGDRTQALQHFRDTLEHPVQVHYVGPRKPWNSFTGVPRHALWFTYLKEAGAVGHYLLDLPRQQVKKLDRLSPKRFVQKMLRSRTPRP